jgi:glutathione S-transferase
MAIVLHHHPFSRAANVVWMLEELGVPYELKFVDILSGANKKDDVTKLNPMGKLPILQDGDALVTESAAIAIYLADRYSSGTLAPKLDDAKRGTYLRWILFAPSVIEPGSMAKAGKWEFRSGAAGWGDYDAMLEAMTSAIEGREWVLGDTFSMADVVFGGTIAFMLKFKMLEPTPVFSAYAERLGARPAFQRSTARNEAVVKEQGIKMPG